MTPTYLAGLCALIMGMVAGLFMRPRWVMVAIAALLSVGAVGLVVNVLFDGGRALNWLLLLGLLGISVLGAVAFCGAAASHALVCRIRRPVTAKEVA